MASLIVRDKVTVKTVTTNHNLFEEKGEPKQGPSVYQPSRLTARPNRLSRKDAPLVKFM